MCGKSSLELASSVGPLELLLPAQFRRPLVRAEEPLPRAFLGQERWSEQPQACLSARPVA